MKDSSELLKDFANATAGLISGVDSRRACHLLHTMGLLKAEPSEQSDVLDGGCAGDRVGIWERKQGASHFVRRRDRMDEWPLWANVSRIGPKSREKLRVVLIGESVARGYLYDPAFTPAMVLQHILQAQIGNNAVEVIDLARTDLSFELKELAQSALLLEPDAVLIFAANNWDASFSAATDIPALYGALAAHGVAGCKAFFEQKLAKTAHAVVSEIASTYASKGVPLLWMIPEFNLADWVDPSENVPVLRMGNASDWIAVRQRAQRALAAQDLALAEELACRMVEMDEGVSRASFYLLAECSRRKGDLHRCREYLEAARDAHIWDRSQLISPRSFTVSQNSVREIMGENVVDVPHLFEEYLDGGIPDRRLFLDYCHLTTEGIQVVIAAAASRLIGLLKGREVSWRELLDRKIVPSDQVEAEAAFLAAIHCAHYGQPGEILLYHCLRAICLSPEIGKVMECFIDFQSRRTPMLMCQSAEQLAGIGSNLVQTYLFHVSKQQLDKRMVDAITEALKRISKDVAEQLEKLRYSEQQAAGGKTNLLDYYYSASAAQPLDTMWVLPLAQQLTASDYFRAHWVESKFIFVARAGMEASVTLTCRLPHLGSGDRSLGVEVNGKSRLQVPAGVQWETWNINVPAELLHDGVNEICVRWPDPVSGGAKATEQAARQLLDGAFPELYCIFGEIHALTAVQSLGTAEPEHELSRMASSSIA